MKTRWKLFAVVLAILAGTWLLMAGAGGVRYVGNFTGNGAGLTNIPQAGVVQLSNSLFYLTNAALGGATGIAILNGYGTNTTLIGTPHIGAGNIITNLVGSGAMSGDGGGLTNISGLSAGTSNWIYSIGSSVNRHFYFSSVTNGIGAATNTSSMIDVPIGVAATNTVAGVIANSYFLSRLTTNTIARLDAGPIDLQTYIWITGGGGVQSVTARPEIYLWFTNDTILEVARGADQVFTEGTGPTIFNISMHVDNGTNLLYGTKLLLRWWASAVANTPTWNSAIGGDYDSHISVNTPSSGGTWIGTFIGDGSGLTNIPQAAVVQLSNSLFYLTNSAAAGIPTLNGFGTNTTLRNPTLVGIVTNTAPLLMSGTITKTNYTTGAWAVESAAGWQLGVTNGGTPTVNVVGSSGAISTVGPVAASLFTGNGQGLTNVNLVNALSVGATGDGTTDDTAALQAAFNITTNGVWLPPGTYLITNTLVLKGFPHIVGSGIQNTFIKADAGGVDTGLEGGNMIQLGTEAVANGAMNGGLLRDFSLDGSGIAANGVVIGTANLYTNATGHMEDMEVKWCTNAGVLVLTSQEFHIVNSSLSWNYNGIYSTTNTGDVNNHSTTLYVDHCKIQANTNCGVYLNYAHTFRFRDNVIQGSGGPGVWFNHGGNLLSWAFIDVLFSGNYFEQNNITAAYRQVGQVRMDTHATYPADKIVFENNYFNSPGGNITTNFFYIGPAYAVLRDNYFAPAWGCITVSNATTVSIMGQSVDTGTTDETGGLGGPDVYFANTTTALPANPNISWTYIGQTNSSEKLISPKRHSVFVNNGDGHLVPASMLYGSTDGSGATAWFPSVIATNLSVGGPMSVGTLIVTNPPVLDLGSSTNVTALASNVTVGGHMAIRIHTNNTFIGDSAGTNITTGYANTVIGYLAGLGMVDASANTIIGYNAGSLMTNAFFNTLIGVQCGGGGAISGTFNTAIGYHSALALTAGNANTFIGNASGGANTVGHANSFFGYVAGNANINGSNNVYFGAQSGAAMTSGDNNVFIGRQSGLVATTPDEMVVVGAEAGKAITTTGTGNVLVGYRAGRNLTDGYANIIIGKEAGDGIQTGIGNIFIGYNPGGTSAMRGHFVAGGAGYGQTNVFFGEGIADATPVSYVINGTAGFGTDIAGGSVGLAGGKSTGTGAGGSINFWTAPASTTGTSTNALVKRGQFESSGNLAISNSVNAALGYILTDAGADIPTNSIPTGSATVTNWWLGTIGGIPTLVATNHNDADGGWLQKALFP